MNSNVEFREINTKSRMCYYFNDIIKIKDFNLDNILIDEKSYDNSFVYNISNKTWIWLLGFARFDQIYVFIRVYDGTRYLVLFGSKIYDFIYNRIR